MVEVPSACRVTVLAHLTPSTAPEDWSQSAMCLLFMRTLNATAHVLRGHDVRRVTPSLELIAGQRERSSRCAQFNRLRVCICGTVHWVKWVEFPTHYLFPNIDLEAFRSHWFQTMNWNCDTILGTRQSAYGTTIKLYLPLYSAHKQMQQ